MSRIIKCSSVGPVHWKYHGVVFDCRLKSIYSPFRTIQLLLLHGISFTSNFPGDCVSVSQPFSTLTKVFSRINQFCFQSKNHYQILFRVVTIPAKKSSYKIMIRPATILIRKISNKTYWSLPPLQSRKSLTNLT